MNDTEAREHDKKLQQALYVTTATNIWHWLRKADDMRAAAALHEPGIQQYWEAVHRKEYPIPRQVQGVYFMLMAYALENLCKAALVRKEAQKISNEIEREWKLPKRLLGHNLLKLVENVEVIIDQGEEDLLRRLSRHSVWAGRYPVPLTLAETALYEVFTDGKEYSVTYFGEKDVERVVVLFDKIRNRLRGGSLF